MTMLKGVPLEDALRRTSDPHHYDEWLDLDGLWQEHADRRSEEARALFARVCELRQALQNDFIEMLVSGDLAATGFRLPIEPGSRRQAISADLWELLEIDFHRSEAEAQGIRLIKIEVLKPTYNLERVLRMSPIQYQTVPDNGFQSETLPPEAALPLVHNDDFSVVELGPYRFTFGAAAANVLRQLHANADIAGGWSHGKALMANAGADGTKVGDLFKRHTDPSWKLLIESDERGHYRLKAK